MKRSTLTVGVLVLLLLGGCGVAGANDVASLEPRADLARKAVLAAVNAVPTGAASSGRDELARVQDPPGDQGAGPRYADLSQATFTASDTGLSVSLALDDVVPDRLARGEMEDVGFDLYRTSPLDLLLGRTRSDYQVRLDGSAYGWQAFFQTRDGYVAFPGTFTVSGRTLSVVLPWEAIGGRRRAEAEAFVDWSSGVGRLSTDGSERVRLAP